MLVVVTMVKFSRFLVGKGVLCDVPIHFDDAANETALSAPINLRQCPGQSFGARPPGPQVIAQGAGGSVYMPKTDGTA